MTGPAEHAKQLGGRIASARRLSGMNQLDLAEELGIRREAVAKMELGLQHVTVAALLKIADATQQSPTWLLSGIGLNSETPDHDLFIRLQETLAMAHITRPGDRSAKDRNYAVAITKLEEAVSYFAYWVLGKGEHVPGAARTEDG